MTAGASISVLVSADFVWPFWLGVIVAGLCVAAKLYHRKIESNKKPASGQPVQPQN